MRTNEKNMTTGSPGKLIITFAIPLMLGNIFQQFYTMADTMIVGQVVGVEALAAVGAGDWLVWLVFGIMTGITQGFSILVAQFYGAREKENLKCAVAKSYIMTALLSVIVLAVSEGAVYHVLLFLQTPDNVIDLTMLYLRLIFAGIPIIAAYNIFAAILRALGNSRSPLIAMTVAALINVGLDLLFVAVFGWGVAGAAVATVIAQGFSALYCLMVLRKIPDIRLEKQDFYRQPAMSLRLLKVATPLAIQNLIISVGGLTVQYVVNGFGFLFVAGFTASNKLYGVLEIAAVSYGYAITTYVGQNLGAKKYQRIRKGVHSGTYMALLTSVVISGVMVLFGRNILSLFVSGEPEQIRQVLDIAYKYLFIMAIFLWVLYLLYVYRSAIQGLGNTLIPLASGIAEFVMRVSVALLLPKLIGEDGIFYAEICAWTSAAVLLFISYMIIIRKYRIRFPLLIYPFHGMITEIQRFQNDYTIHFRGFFDGALSLYLARSHTNFRSHLRTSFPAVLLLSVRLMAGHIKETFILLFTMAGACLIVFLVPGLFVLFPGILCGIASHLIEPGLKKALAID